MPYGVDPRTSRNEGLFTVPYHIIINEKCLSSIQIGHMRTKEGYNKMWFDQEYVSRDLEQFYYYLTIPKDIPENAYLYFTVGSYY